MPVQFTNVAIATAADLGAENISNAWVHILFLFEYFMKMNHCKKIYIPCVKSSPVISQGIEPGPKAKNTTNARVEIKLYKLWSI